MSITDDQYGVCSVIVAVTFIFPYIDHLFWLYSLPEKNTSMLLKKTMIMNVGMDMILLL